MKKFQFKLDTVLKLRTRIEEQRQQELRQAQYIRDEAQRQLEYRRAQQDEMLNAYRQRVSGNLDLATMIHYDRYSAWLKQMVVLDEAHLQTCEVKVADARQRLVEASKEKKIVDKLKEKAYREYQTAELHAEIEFLDELGTSRFNRQDQET
ncbi:MAG TPA: flagellar export protein FliJ [Bacillota bacterium]|nr:flagellar export protein FliJ [Bacillota bacterium]HPT88044.1 flagellar export protein FliJ [Bacillota bacterium]